MDVLLERAQLRMLISFVVHSMVQDSLLPAIRKGCTLRVEIWAGKCIKFMGAARAVLQLMVRNAWEQIIN